MLFHETKLRLVGKAFACSIAASWSVVAGEGSEEEEEISKAEKLMNPIKIFK